MDRKRTDGKDRARGAGRYDGVLRFVLGDAGAGKTRLCLTEALEYACPSIPITRQVDNGASPHESTPPVALILVPDQATSQYERELLRLSPRHTLTGVSVTGFSRLPFFLSAPAVDTPVVANRSVRRMLLYRAVMDNAVDAPVFARGASFTGVLDQALDLFDELTRSGVDCDVLGASIDSGERAWLAARLGEMACVYADYRTRLDAVGMTDELAASLGYANSLADIERIPGLRVWIDGFSHFSAVELRVLEELLRIADVTTVSLLVTPNLLSSSVSHPAELVHTSLLGHTLETYLRLDALATTHGMTRDYVNLNETHDRLLPVAREGAVDARARRGAVRVVRAPTRVAEVRHVARAIRKLIAAGARYRDIAVLTRSLATYEKLIATGFERYAVPHFIDTPRRISDHPAMRLVLDLVEYAVEPSFATFFEIARNPVLRHDSAVVDRFENFILRVGFRVEELGSPQFSKELATSDADFATLDSVFIVPLSEFVTSISDCTTAAELSTVILDLLRRLKVDARMAEYARDDASWDADSHSAAWRTAIDSLEDIAAVCGEERIGLTLYRDLLSAALASATAKVSPPSLDQVVVSDVDRGRQMNPHHVFVLGLVEGEFPITDPPMGVLSPDERSYIKSLGIRLEDDGIRRHIYERYLFYVACTRASESLTLTVPIKESNDTLASSFLTLLSDDAMVETLDCDEPEIPRDIADATTPLELASWLKLHGGCPTQSVEAGNEIECAIGADLMRLVVSPQHRFPGALAERVNAYRIARWARVPVSRLETLAACPFAHFAAYDARLRERQIFSWDAPKIGTVLHLALKLTLDESLERRASWKGGDRSLLLEILKRKFDEVISDPDLNIARSSYAKMLARKSYRDLKAFFETTLDALNRGGFIPVAGEVEFGYEGGGKSVPFEIASPAGSLFRLTGKIDRIDVNSQMRALAVIDYKSRQMPIDWARLYYGLDLQLLMYGYALSKSGTALGEIVARAAQSLGITLKDEGAPVEAAKAVGFTPLVMLRAGIEPEIANSASAADAESSPKPAKPRGAFHEAAASILDPHAQGHSDYYQFFVKKDGGFGKLKDSDTLAETEWRTLWMWFETRLMELLAKFDSGEISVAPIEVKNRSSCAFCLYRQVCRVDNSNDLKRLPNPGADGKPDKISVLQTMAAQIAEARR